MAIQRPQKGSRLAHVLRKRSYFGTIVTTFAFALAFFTVQPAFAYQISPLTVDLPMSPGASATVRVENTNSVPVTLETSVVKRIIDAVGNGEEEAADDDFVVLPPQTILQPGKTQNIRIQYVGEPPAVGSLHYYVKIEQLPVTFLKKDETSGSAQFLLNYHVNVNLSRAGAEVNLTEVSATMSGEPQVAEIVIKNEGEKYIPLSMKDFIFKNASGEEIRKAAQMYPGVGANVVPGNSERRVKVKLPDEFNATAPLTLTIVDRE